MVIRIGLAAAIALAVVIPLPAAETSAPALDTGPGSDVARYVDALDDVEFARRQEASQRLTEAGKAAFPELERAAVSGSREASARAIEILARHFERGEDEVKQAARAALERLAASGSAGAAQRADSVLHPPPEAEAAPQNQFGAVPARVAGNIQIQVAANNGNARRVHIRNVNGKKEIEVEENGRKTRIQDGANGGIEVEITDKKDGKEKTEKVQAKDLAELKTKNPEAARIYEQYQGGMQNVPKEIAGRMVQSIDNQIKQLEAQAANNPALQRHIDLLKERKKEFERLAEGK
jgi:hypothetical protein